MITENYVSFETAKLLKEKGFDEYCGYYDKTGEYISAPNNTFNHKGDEYISAPTLQVAMKWLREVHKLFIEIAVGDYEGRIWYDFDVINIGEKDIPIVPIVDIVKFKTYEEAVEAALKYCLTNLI